MMLIVGLVLGAALPILGWILRPSLDSILLGCFGGAWIVFIAYEMWIEGLNRAASTERRDRPAPAAAMRPTQRIQAQWAKRPASGYIDPPTIPNIDLTKVAPQPQPEPVPEPVGAAPTVEPEPQPEVDEPSPLAAEVAQAEGGEVPEQELTPDEEDADRYRWGDNVVELKAARDAS